MSEEKNAVVTGSCACGAISYRVSGALRPVIACHCVSCRKQGGHFVAATAAADADLVIDGAADLTWYAATSAARRGFCRHCGSTLFWKAEGSATTSIFAGSLDDPTGLTLERHIFCAEKGDYYEIADGLPQHDGDMR